MFTIKNWEEYTYYLFIYLKDGSTAKFRSDFFQLHPNNQLNFFYMLYDTHRQKFYEVMKPSEFGRVFSKLDLSLQQSVLKELTETFALQMIESLPKDEIVKYLNKLGQEDVGYYLKSMKKHDADKINVLLAYEADTVGAMMTTEYVTAHKTDTVATVLKRLKILGKDAESIYYIYIITMSLKLVGVVSLRDLIVLPHDHTMKFIMKEQVISVEPTRCQKEIVKLFKDYDLLLLPVVSASNELIGIVTIDDVMDIDNTEVVSRTSIKNQLSLISILFISVIIMSQFITETTTLIFIFTLLIAGIAGITSTQAGVYVLEALSRRKINKDAFISLMKKEAFAVFFMAMTCGALSSMVGLVFIKNNAKIGVAIGLAIFFAIFSSTIIGALIPYLTQKKMPKENTVVSINALVISIICFSVAITFFYSLFISF